jgi:muramoyltetrapeptide carboxypeptidase
MLALVTLAFPEPLAPGDLAVVVAPSGPCAPDELWRGLGWLRSRYRLSMSAGVLEREGYLAGGDPRRARELTRAMLDPNAKAIVVVRGGYGALRIAADLPWREFAARPKWLVGFSDVTTLLAMAWRAGVASVHAPNVTGLGRDPSPAVRAAWIAALERPTAPRRWTGLGVVREGEAGGPIVGGNLAIVHALAAAGQLAVPPGSVVALEDVGEAPYRVDRMLTSLVLGGHLRAASAIVFGGFERCASPGDPRAIDDVLVDCTRGLGIPVLTGAPFGHGAHNEAFVVGSPVRVRGDEVCFDVDVV